MIDKFLQFQLSYLKDTHGNYSITKTELKLFSIYEIEVDIVELEHGTKLQVTNSLGVMGRGLALDFANKHEGLASWYKSSNPIVGNAYIYYLAKEDITIVNLCAQSRIGDSKKTGIRYLEMDSLKSALLDYCKQDKILPLKPVYVPYLMGCGLAGGNWSEVLNLLTSIFPWIIICKKPKAV